MKRNCYPVRHILDYSHQLVGCSFFSKIDLVRTYNLIVVPPDDIQKTAITTPFGLLKFPFMPFSLYLFTAEGKSAGRLRKWISIQVGQA
jgi:hypothetical protein